MKKGRNMSLVVDEGPTSIWFYHMKRKGEYVALCGKPVLGKNLPTELWGYKSHVGEKYCKECEKLKEKEDE